METTCVHSCKGLCVALKVAEAREEETIREYQRYADECNYPDVRKLLVELITHRRKGLAMVRQAREMLDTRFETLGDIEDNYA
jgi:rubrerythrin